MPTHGHKLSLAAVPVLTAISLALPAAPLYDPFAWLVWGRELTELSLDTSVGPSWKPLPAMVAALLVPLGDAAPDGWLAVTRAGWLAAAGLAGVLAARLALPADAPRVPASPLPPERARRVRALAASTATVGVVLLSDPFTSWARQFAGGLSEPLLVALVLAAVERHLKGRGGQALGLGLAAALLRPEAWPFLLLYGVHLWRRAPALRGAALIAALAVPLLWMVPDLLGSGDPLTGAARAREGTGWPPAEAVEAAGRSLALPLAGLWAAAAWAVLSARRQGELAIQTLAAGALAWIAIVALLAAAGYAGLPRFAAPAGALACVLGAVGFGRLLVVAGARAGGPRLAAVGAAVIAAALVAQGAFRAAELPGELEAAADYGRGEAELAGLVDDLGREHLLACGPVATADLYTQTALAWRLGLPISAVAFRVETAPAAGIFFVDADAPAAAREAARAAGRALAQRGRWSAYEISCADANSSTGASSDAPAFSHIVVRWP